MNTHRSKCKTDARCGLQAIGTRDVEAFSQAFGISLSVGASKPQSVALSSCRHQALRGVSSEWTACNPVRLLGWNERYRPPSRDWGTRKKTLLVFPW